MAENSKIEWCDHTFNPWEGCTKVGPGCDHCYAEARNIRFTGGENWGPGAPRRRTSAANWAKPLKWNKQAGELRIRYRVFCASLADVFDNEIDPAWRADLFTLITNTPNLDWLLLTKRIGNVKGMVPLPWVSKPFQHGPDPKNIYPAGWPPNVWIGATIVNQEEADRDIPKLLDIPAAIRFLSMEPLLGPVNLPFPSGALGPENFPDGMDSWSQKRRDDWFEMQARATYISRTMLVDWVIAGGESGRDSRPSEADWYRSLRDQCKKFGVAFLFKQWGEYAPNWLNDDDGKKIPGSEWMDRQGKKIAGRHLDGITHTEFPAPPVKSGMEK